jgi:hypothetical protein
MKRALILCGLAASLLGAPGCATHYQALQDGAAFPEGYSEEKLSENSWRVSFAGNSATPASDTYRYALLRGAELAEGGGFEAFTIDSVETTVSHEDAVTAVSLSAMDGGTNGVPGNSFSPGSADPPPTQYVPPSGGSGGWPVSSYVRRPETVLVVTAFHGEETAGRSNAFTVESFQPELQRLRPHSPQAER